MTQREHVVPGVLRHIFQHIRRSVAGFQPGSQPPQAPLLPEPLSANHHHLPRWKQTRLRLGHDWKEPLTPSHPPPENRDFLFSARWVLFFCDFAELKEYRWRWTDLFLFRRSYWVFLFACFCLGLVELFSAMWRKRWDLSPFPTVSGRMSWINQILFSVSTRDRSRRHPDQLQSVSLHLFTQKHQKLPKSQPFIHSLIHLFIHLLLNCLNQRKILSS